MTSKTVVILIGNTVTTCLFKKQSGKVIAPKTGYIAVKQLKGEKTRAVILDATVQCYTLHGYAKTTLIKIAHQAEISMGAISHHFPSMADLNLAAIHYTFEMRLNKHKALIESALAVPEDFETALEIYWTETLDPLFIACHELAVAARTDQALKAEFIPEHDRFRRLWSQILLKLHPGWQNTGDMFLFAVEFSTHIIEGLALSWLLTSHPKEGMQKKIRDYLKDNLEDIQQAATDGVRTREMLAPGRARRKLLLRGK